MTKSALEKRVKHRFSIPGLENTTMDVKNSENLHPNCTSIYVEKRNLCVIFPVDVSIKTEAVEKTNKFWSVQSKVASDLKIQLGDNKFFLHKLPMVSRSGYINRLVFKNAERSNHGTIQIDNLPGGAKIFEIVVKFCYGLKVNLTAKNVAPLYCAAHFLEMSDDLKQGNLVSKTEAFLSFLILSSWKDTFRIIKSGESISSYARGLKILERCSEAIASKACRYIDTSSFGIYEVFLNVETENVSNLEPKKLPSTWWFEDVSSLRIDHFIEVIAAIKKKKMKPKLVGSCIVHWTRKWISQIKDAQDNSNHDNVTVQLRRVTAECLIRILPVEEDSVACNFLLHLLKIGLVIMVDSELLNQLERRISFMLESCKAEDLLVRSRVTLFDVDIVVKALEAYVSIAYSNPMSRICVVGRLIDEYLVLVAKVEKLQPKSFQSLVEALPKRARYCDDNLYRAIDKYLKAHPNLIEEDRSSICRVLEYNKLSQEALKHATKNERLPVSMTTQFMLLEQVNMTRSLTSTGSYYQRTKSQAILRVSNRLSNCTVSSRKEVKGIKEDVEKLKTQLSELQLRRMELHKQMKKSFA